MLTLWRNGLAFPTPVRFGFHVSIAGGFANVRERALKVGCETMQLFSSNPRGWKAAALDGEDVARFRADLAAAGIAPVFVHAPYLPNLAATRAATAKRSIRAIVQQMERCYVLGVGYLVVHVGRGRGVAEERALAQVATNVNRILAVAPAGIKVLLENTAGMGSEVGYRFEQLAAIIERIEQRDRMGVVLDTAHAFEAGYELRTKQGLDQALREFDRLVGLGRLHLLHLNDSRTDIGSCVDRHWHIGQGRIGLDGFRVIVNHPLLRNLPGIMETPRKTPADDRRNLETVRSLVN